MVGLKNCSTVPLKYILNPVYTSMMINKLINFDKDVSREAQTFDEDFKKIVTGEEITSNDKYETPFDFRPFCKMVLSANIFPKITDHSSAFYNRLIIIPCNRIFAPEEQNRNLREQLLEELSGIFNWAIDGLIRLNKRGMFEENTFVHEAIDELERENNPAYQFFDEHIDVDVSDGRYILKSELYDKYKNWAQRNGAYPLSNILFGKCVFNKYHKHTPKASRLSNNGPMVWRSIKYVENKTSSASDITTIVQPSNGQAEEVKNIDWTE
jgi:putative DNA primase/helicase